MPLRKWYDAIGNNESEEFKYAAGVLICGIINLKKDKLGDELCEFCKNFQKAHGISDEEAENLYKNPKKFEANLDQHIKTVKTLLGNSDHKKLEFMHMLNHFIVQDDCKECDYALFETIKEKLFS